MKKTINVIVTGLRDKSPIRFCFALLPVVCLALTNP